MIKNINPSIIIAMLLYAYDILILSHIKHGINKLLRLIEEYENNNEIKFNPIKLSLWFLTKILT